MFTSWYLSYTSWWAKPCLIPRAVEGPTGTHPSIISTMRSAIASDVPSVLVAVYEMPQKQRKMSWHARHNVELIRIHATVRVM